LPEDNESGAEMNWVLVSKFIELTGYTDDAVRAKLRSAVWHQGRHWNKAGGRIHISMVEFNKWVTLHGSLTAESEIPGTTQ
jgi:hypothetical protein